MPVTELNHYFVRAKDLERTKNFYCKVLGFEEMPRPNFPFPGYWLGVGGKIQIHMGQAGVEREDLYYLGTTRESAKDNSGVVDHIAFLASDPDAFMQRFKELSVESRNRSFPESELYQIFLKDPDGLMIELNFFGVKNVKNWGGEMYSEMPKAQGSNA